MDKANLVEKAIQAVHLNKLSYCKFLSANDTGSTGAHQSGIYIAKNAISILFDTPGLRGENKEKLVRIKWQDDFITDSRFVYYGDKTRNEYRITRFGRGFPFLQKEHTGDLLILSKMTEEDYEAYVLETEDDINAFLDSFGMSPTDTGAIISVGDSALDAKMELWMTDFIQSLEVDFPVSSEMSEAARRLVDSYVFNMDEIWKNPDKSLVLWIEMEYQLFKKIEHLRYGKYLNQHFRSVEEFIEVANTVLNRRKSRAGKSLENHLGAIFDANLLQYTYQARTEGNKKPDFIFPSEESYHNPLFPDSDLIFLGAKTTCKDRWRQVINEANRIGHKHLFTLQQGISAKQLDEMADEKVILVVPQQYLNTFPTEKTDEIWTLKKFIEYAKEKART